MRGISSPLEPVSVNSSQLLQQRSMVRRVHGVKWSLGVLQLPINYGTTTNRLAMTAGKTVHALSFIVLSLSRLARHVIALLRYKYRAGLRIARFFFGRSNFAILDNDYSLIVILIVLVPLI